LDRLTMMGLRGYDESVRSARLHLDSRMCWNAMSVVSDCTLLGRIYHINHHRSFINVGSKYPGRSYNYAQDLPYVNPANWGLADYHWQADGPRLWRVSPSRDAGPRTVPLPLDRRAYTAVEAV